MLQKRSLSGVVLKTGLVVVGLLLLTMGWWVSQAQRPVATTEASGQPIQFSHALHTQNNVRCIVCHPYYKDTPRAGLPGVNTCRRCHEEVAQPHPEQRKIQEYYEANREIPWMRVYQVPSNVYFSHRRHVMLGQIECVTCHGDVASRKDPLTEPLKALKMGDCIACHQEQRQKTALENVQECIRCHR